MTHNFERDVRELIQQRIDSHMVFDHQDSDHPCSYNQKLHVEWLSQIYEGILQLQNMSDVRDTHQGSTCDTKFSAVLGELKTLVLGARVQTDLSVSVYDMMGACSEILKMQVMATLAVLEATMKTVDATVNRIEVVSRLLLPLVLSLDTTTRVKSLERGYL